MSFKNVPNTTPISSSFTLLGLNNQQQQSQSGDTAWNEHRMFVFLLNAKIFFKTPYSKKRDKHQKAQASKKSFSKYVVHFFLPYIFFKAKPGRYMIEVANMAPKISFTAAKLKAEVVCGTFADQIEDIPKQQKWGTGTSVSPVQTADIIKVTVISDQPAVQVSYSIKIHQCMIVFIGC